MNKLLSQNYTAKNNTDLGLISKSLAYSATFIDLAILCLSTAVVYSKMSLDAEKKKTDVEIRQVFVVMFLDLLPLIGWC